MKKLKVAILISGRGSNMKALIEACKDSHFPAEIALVISNKQNAQGLDFARKNGIDTVVINHKNFVTRQEFDQEMTKEIEKRECVIICLAGFMRLLSREFVDHWFDRLINIHPSLLPDFKGANAVEDALRARVSESGCTVHFVREEVDSGPIIEQASVSVLPNDTKDSLAARILQQEHKIYPLALKVVCSKILGIR